MTWNPIPTGTSPTRSRWRRSCPKYGRTPAPWQNGASGCSPAGGTTLRKSTRLPPAGKGDRVGGISPAEQPPLDAPEDRGSDSPRRKGDHSARRTDSRPHSLLDGLGGRQGNGSLSRGCLRTGQTACDGAEGD